MHTASEGRYHSPTYVPCLNEASAFETTALAECPEMSTELNRNIWRRAVARLAVVFGVIVTIAFGVFVTVAWIGLLAHGFAALISWAI